METVERFDEAGIVFVCIGKLRHQPTSEIRYALLEVLDCFVEVLVRGDRVRKESDEERNELLRLSEVGLYRYFAVLVEIRLASVFKDRVGERIAFGNLLLDLGFQLVL